MDTKTAAKTPPHPALPHTQTEMIPQVIKFTIQCISLSHLASSSQKIRSWKESKSSGRVPPNSLG